MFVGVLRFLLIVVEIVSAFLLIGAVLIQRTRGQGIGLAFGSGMGESLFGAQAGNVLTRATVILTIVFLLNTAMLSLLQTKRQEALSVTERMPAAAAPAVPATPATGTADQALPAPLSLPETAVPAPETVVPVEGATVESLPPADAAPVVEAEPAPNVAVEPVPAAPAPAEGAAPSAP